MTAPVGATGLIACSGNEGSTDPSVRPPLGFRGSLSLGISRSHLKFGDDTSWAIEKSSIVGGSDFVLNDRFSIEIAAGGVMKGSLRLIGGKSIAPIRAIGPGWLGAASMAWTVVKQKRFVPYLVLSATLAATRAATRSEPTQPLGSRGSFLGTDFRFGATLGETFWNVFSPYLALRVFGGPAFLTNASKTQLGSDAYHVQPAVGAVVLCGRHVDIFAEGAPVLERAMTIGIGLRR